MIEVGQKWEHLKRGHQYEILDTDAAMQIAPERVGAHRARQLEAMAFVAYRRVGEARIFFRPADEFLDGRFRRVE